MKSITVLAIRHLSKNNLVIYLTNGTRVLNSCGVNVAEIRKGKTRLDKRYWNYSYTACRGRCAFLGEKIDETDRKIRSGEYILTDLNYI